MKKAPAKKINVRLLRAIGAKALRFPETSDMNNYGRLHPKTESHPCGAVAAVLMKSKAAFLRQMKADRDFRWWAADLTESPFFKAGAKELGLTVEQAERLFLPESWPQRLWRRYENANLNATRARILNERIELFIKTKGEQ